MKYFGGSIIILGLLLVIYVAKGKEKMSDLNTHTKSRIETALENKGKYVNQLLQGKGIQLAEFKLFFRAFKAEEILEIWAKDSQSTTFILLKSYPFCSNSGELGPKRKEGDFQVPEGVYFINRFNPKSQFHLSLGLNYPNKSDRIRGDKDAPGSDIFIHGGCKTVGCIPITDPGIEEVYLLTELANQNSREKIPVHIFPFRMSEHNVLNYSKKSPSNAGFWQELKPVFDSFESDRALREIEIDEKGTYSLAQKSIR